jgi:glycosyltransferase involved in cell wall biosynthesis
VIGVVTTSYPRFPDDSSGGFVRERVRALRRAGQEVEILAAGDGGQACAGGERGSENGRVTRIPGHALFYAGGAPEALARAQPGARLSAWVRALGFSGALLGELVRRRGRWHAVESHWLLPCGLIAGVALPGLPHRAHVHGGDVHLLGRLPGGQSILRGLCRGRPELVCASASLRAELTALLGGAPESFGASCRVEAAPFDAAVFGPRTPEERQQAKSRLGCARPTVLGAGRLVPIKGFDVLVAAGARLPPEARPLLLIAGEGPERTRLAEQARALQVELRLPGLLAPRALAMYMAAADLFVHPCRTLADGRREGMPLVVREALARGLPVVASASGGLPELRGAPGLTLVEADDASALTMTMAQVLAAVS